MRSLAIVVLLVVTSGARAADTVVVASKSFTESVVLGEIATHLLRDAGIDVRHRQELGGTRVVFEALVAGEVDVYAEYSGTLIEEILSEADVSTLEEVESRLSLRGIRMTAPLGFNNSYAIGMRPDTADRLGIHTISDLRDHTDVRLGLSSEFMDRGDGWPSLRAHYGLDSVEARGIDHDLAYRALEAGDIEAMDLYTTDAEIEYYGLRVLADDREFFRTYLAVYLYRADLDPRAARALGRAAGTIDEPTIRGLNARVKLDGVAENVVTADFVGERLGVEARVRTSTLSSRLWLRTREHLFLVGIAMGAGVLVAIPLGVIAARRRRLGQLVLAAVGVLQTIPALALLVFMIPLLGIYEPPAIAALFLYSLLPMVRSTHAGLCGIPPSLEESAEALGLSRRARLWRIELPLASPSILSGIKTSTVIVIGFATLGALIGAGGYGQPIFTGIRLDDFSLILEGAAPAALLALLAQGAFDLVERVVVPRGLRLRRSE